MIASLVIITIVIALLLYGGNTVLIKREPLEFPGINFKFWKLSEEDKLKVLQKPKSITKDDTKNAPDPFELKCYFRDDVYNYDGKLKKAGSEVNCSTCNNYYYKTQDNLCLPMGFDKKYNKYSCDNDDVRSSCLPISKQRGTCSLGGINQETGNWTIDPEPKTCPN